MGQRSLAALLVAALLALTALGGCSGEADQPPPGIADPSFYLPPDPLPAGKPGDVLRVETVDGTAGAGEVLRVLYRSESLAGAPIAVSGIIAVPGGEPPAGGWPVLSIAHGTVGLADACAPSFAPGPQSSVLAAQGFVVVATDYEGLGPPGRHPYLVGESEARGVIDAVRAARALGERVGAGSRYAVLGWSQGGQAALFADEITSTWAPELTLVGAAAGAPVVELERWLDVLTSPTWDWLQVMVAAGMQAVDPAADPALVLTPSGRQRLPVVEEQCSGEVMAAYADGGALSADLRRTPPFDRLLVTGTAGQRPGSAPVLLAGGSADELIPVELLDLAQARLCAQGTAVERKAYAGVDHAGIITSSLTDFVRWATDRFAGAPPASAC